MRHIGIDLGGRKSQICVRNGAGDIECERSVQTADVEQVLAYYGKAGCSRVIVETCSEGFAIADIARREGHEVRVIASTLARTLGVGSRGVKNDRKDARVLSETSTRIDLPSVHVPSMTSREIKTLCGMRDALIQARTQWINTVRGWLRQKLVRVKSGATSSFPTRVRLACAGQGVTIPSYVHRQLELIGQLTLQIKEADADVVTCAQSHPVAVQLMTVPGIGPVTALRFIAAIDEVSRFRSAAQVGSYLGLTPGQRQSGDRNRRTHITKAGAPALRWTLIQAAWVLYRVRPGEPMVRWAKAIAERRGAPIAIVALARKLSGLLFAMWREGTVYDAARAASHLNGG